MSSSFDDFKETTPPEFPDKKHDGAKVVKKVFGDIDNHGNIIIPVKTTKQVMPQTGKSSDLYLKYVVDNETGNYLQLDGNILKLFSKTNKLLSAISIPEALPDYSEFRNRYLFVDDFGNLTWTLNADDDSKYYSGVAISIDEDKKINLIYDQDTLLLNDDGKLAVNLNRVQEKLVDGDNIIIEGNRISAKDTTYHAGEGVIIDENTNRISIKEEYKDYYFADNKPSINGVTLLGALLGKDLKLDVIEYMSYKDYRRLEPKERKLYFVCKNTKDVDAENC